MLVFDADAREPLWKIRAREVRVMRLLCRRPRWFCALGGSIFVSLAMLSGCGTSSDGASTTNSSGGAGATLSTAVSLELVSEKKFSKLIAGSDLNHFEASGVIASGGKLYVAFDNTKQIATLDTSLTSATLGPGDVTQSQYEGITATDDARFLAMIESVSESDARSAVAQLDANTAFTSMALTDTAFAHVNKGFEGIAWLRKSGTEYLLGLCENNACKDDDTSPGQGRVKVMVQIDGVWTTQVTLQIPSSVAFLNYSDLALRDNGDGSYAAAIVSRRSSLLWMGTLTTSPWALTGPNSFYTFPRTNDGEIQYCSVEGVSFLGANVLAFVSDKRDGAPCSDKAESVHLFQLPP
jgi:hypothetical protein